MGPRQTVFRNYAIDWLRVLAILMIFCFHSMRFFDLTDWHVKNGQTYFVVQMVTAFLSSWGMPLIFVLSGASTFYALGKRQPTAFMQERSARLFVPLVVGIFTHIALQVYLERLTHGAFTGSFWAFLPHYFDGLYGLGGNFAWMGLHLWYLEMLWLFSLLCLPLLWWLRCGSGVPVLTQLGTFLTRAGRIYWLAAPIMLVLVFSNPNHLLLSRVWGGWNLAAYMGFFLYGFLLVSYAPLQERARQLRWYSLGAAATLLVVIFLLWVNGGEPISGSVRFALFFMLLGVHAWCWILTLWGFSVQHLNFGNPVLLHANEAVLPFYIMHQTVLLSVGYFVVPLALPALVKWGVIFVTSLAIITILYRLVVQPNNIVRILFGMKPLTHRAQSIQPPDAGSTSDFHAAISPAIDQR